MTPEEFRSHRASLQAFLALTHQATAAIVLASFLAYALAGYLWWQGQNMPALLLATLGYLVFRAFRPLATRLARWRLAERGGDVAALGLLRRELAVRRPQEVLTEIEAYMAQERNEQGEA